MEQNVIAVIWDFDKTLADGYMQKPIFDRFGVEEKEFWHEVNNLKDEYKKQNIRINKDTVYLNHFITCVKQGIFKDLNNEMLRGFGAELVFYPGIPDIFEELNSVVNEGKNYKEFNISLEHYIVSTGLTEIIRGSLVNQYIKTIWGCEFIENPIRSAIDIKEYKSSSNEKNSEISQIAYAIDNTTKTRALFEINKGVNLYEEVDVNAKMEKKDRRVPFENMIYVADGPSDVPAFSVIKSNGGKAFAVYPKGDTKAFRQVNKLIIDGRIDMFGEADYTNNSTTNLWLKEQIDSIASKIYATKKQQISDSVSKAPEHINE